MENPLNGIDDIETIEDPAERAREIGRRLDAIPHFQTRLRLLRQSAVLQMKTSGMTYAAIAAEIGLHRNRVQQIAEGRTAGGQGGPGGGKVEKPPTPPTKKAARPRKSV